MDKLKWIFKSSNTGLVVQRRPKSPLGYRITPYIELRLNKEEYNKINNLLLSIGVSSTYHRGRLRIQGIQNCLLMTDIINDSWFLEVMDVYRLELNNSKSGVVKLLTLREERKRPNILRQTYGECINTITQSSYS